MNIATHKCRPYVNDERIRKQVNKFIFHKKWQMKRDFFFFFFFSYHLRQWRKINVQLFYVPSTGFLKY